MPNVDLRDCECDQESSHLDLQSILMMFRCAECRNVQGSIVADIDKAIDMLTKLRALQIDRRAAATRTAGAAG